MLIFFSQKYNIARFDSERLLNIVFDTGTLVLGIVGIAIATPAVTGATLGVAVVIAGIQTGKIMLDVTDWYWHGWRIKNEF